MPSKPPRLTLSPKELLVLELLGRHPGLYGLQLVAASRRRLKRGTIYVTLGRMAAKGLIASQQAAPPPDAGGPPRRLYEATPLGRRALAVWSGALRELRTELA